MGVLRGSPLCYIKVRGEKIVGLSSKSTDGHPVSFMPDWLSLLPSKIRRICTDLRNCSPWRRSWQLERSVIRPLCFTPVYLFISLSTRFLRCLIYCSKWKSKIKNVINITSLSTVYCLKTRFSIMHCRRWLQVDYTGLKISRWTGRLKTESS